MALLQSTSASLGSIAPDFSLPGTDGKNHQLTEFNHAKALVVVFMCNHCPYVKAVQRRINQLAKEYQKKGVQVVGINPNDPDQYPDDSLESMKQRAADEGYVFPYLQDLSQEVARAYDAVCTPDFFVYSNKNNKFLLTYKGRLDDNWKDESAVRTRDLALALDAVLSGGEPSGNQIPSMGCSIKWKYHSK